VTERRLECCEELVSQVSCQGRLETGPLLPVEEGATRIG
jgi:hypothetical protein